MDNSYNPQDYGKKEEEMMTLFDVQLNDARDYFMSTIKPRLDRSYKLYISYNGDRAKEIKKWQANVFVPYTQAVVETLMPRILDARPDFTVQGRNEDDQLKAAKLQNINDYTWEVARMDTTSELVTRASLVYGTGYLQSSWKKDVRTHKFLQTKDISKRKYTWTEKEEVFYDAPYAEWVDNYSLWYDWHNIARESKQYWFKRLILTRGEIERRYPMADKKRLDMAMISGSSDLNDYAAIRVDTKYTHDTIIKGADWNKSGAGSFGQSFNTAENGNVKLYEVFEWWRPFEDSYAVMVNKVPILKGGYIPNPYNHKEAPFIDVPYLRLPGEFEGYGLPMLLENPQIMLNMIKNQRLDAATLGIHKMWIVNPLANINKDELVTRPFGIIYSTDPNGVREVQFSDIKSSAYEEEKLLKSDMRYAAGVDDFSMGAGGAADSATEVRHLRESTLERVRLFVNHLGEAYSSLMRHWISMYNQFWTGKMMIRVAGDDGETEYQLIEKDDLRGEFDFKATVIPSIAGMNDVKKKQDMDLFQLLINLPFVDPKKLTQRVLHSWNWALDSISKGDEAPMPGAEQGMMPPGAEQAGMPPGMPPEMMQQGMMPQMPQGNTMSGPIRGLKVLSPSVVQNAMALLGKQASPFAEASMPINLLNTQGPPPTPAGIKGPTTNPRGLNRGGKVNTNIPLNQTANPESSLMNRVFNIQR